jgi:hypothetical protein
VGQSSLYATHGPKLLFGGLVRSILAEVSVLLGYLRFTQGVVLLRLRRFESIPKLPSAHSG